MNLSIIGSSNHMERKFTQPSKSSFTLNTSLNPNAAEFVPSSLRPNPGLSNPGIPNPGNGNPGIGIPNIPEFIPASLRSPKENGFGNPAFLRSPKENGFGDPAFLRSPKENGFGDPAFLRSPKENGFGNPAFLRSPSGNSGFGNPNAPEFVPASLRSQTGNGNPGNQILSLQSRNRNPGNQIPDLERPKEEVLNRSDSNVSNQSDDEIRQYWRVQLPDDLTPDFKPSQEDETVISPSMNGNSRAMWGKQFNNSMNGRDVNSFNGESSGSEVPAGGVFGEDSLNPINPMKFLNMKFPGFNTQALADVYLKSGRDLGLTVEILTEMESQNRKSKSFASPNLITLDSPSNPSNLFRTLSTPARRIGDSDLLNEINNNNGNNNNNQWRFNRGDGPSLNRIGSGRLFRNLSGVNGSFNGIDDAPPGGLSSPWLETGENLGNLHLESKEEVRNLALLRNVCLEQARQAYLSGNDSLSKELTLKGQLYNMQIKAAQDKAKEALSQHNRSLPPSAPIDLRGLHASEALHVLAYELAARRRALRAAGRRGLDASVLLGAGFRAHVEHYLAENGFACAQTQPGVLRVVMY